MREQHRDSVALIAVIDDDHLDVSADPVDQWPAAGRPGRVTVTHRHQAAPELGLDRGALPFQLGPAVIGAGHGVMVDRGTGRSRYWTVTAQLAWPRFSR